MQNLTIGTTANVLLGYDEQWLSKTANHALFPVSGKALKEIPPELPAAGTWSLPCISLHDHAESLLNELLPYRMMEPDGTPGKPDLPPGRLMLGDDRAKSLGRLSKTLGLNLENPEYGFSLVKLVRSDGVHTHPLESMGILTSPGPDQAGDYGATREFLSAQSKLRRFKDDEFSPDRLELDEARNYLNFFSKFGTHFVSSIEYGDVIFQVFAHPKARFAKIKAAYQNEGDKLRGDYAVFFRQYTAAYDGEMGYVAEYGNILSFSDDKNLASSIAKGDWTEATYARRPTIFAPFAVGSPVALRTLNTLCTKSAGIKVMLTMLTLFFEYSRGLAFRRIFKAAALHKYHLDVGFDDYGPHPDSYLKINSLTEFLTTLPMAEISIYRPAVNLAEVFFVFSEIINSVTLCAEHLHSSAPAAKMPGRDVVIVAQQISLRRHTVLELTDQAFAKAVIRCKRFYGALLVKSTSGRAFCIADGLKYAPAEGLPNHSYVSIEEDIRQKPEAALLPRLHASLEYSFAFLEATVRSLPQTTAPDVLDFFCNSLEWLTQIIPPDGKDKVLPRIRLACLSMLAFSLGQEEAKGAFVPVLPATEYEKHINSSLKYAEKLEENIFQFNREISDLKAREKTIASLNELNDNVVKTGGILLGFVKASLEQQRDIARNYEVQITQKKLEADKLDKAIRDAETELRDQRVTVELALQRYANAVTVFKQKEVLKLCQTLVTSLFSTVVPFVPPSNLSGAAKSLATTALDVQKLLQAIGAASKAYSDPAAAHLVEAQKLLGEGSLEVRWDELGVHLDHCLTDDIADSVVRARKHDLLAAFKIFVLRGSGLASRLLARQAALQEIHNSYVQKELVDKHVERLAAIDAKLAAPSPTEKDLAGVDLAGLIGPLFAAHAQVMRLLVKMFMLKEYALRYEFMMPSTVIASFTAMGIAQAVSEQSAKEDEAKSAWRQRIRQETQPVRIEVEVPASALQNGKTYNYSITPDHPFFTHYAFVRLTSVLAEVSGIKSTAGNEYSLKLEYDGSVFTDKNVDGTLMTFNTLNRDAFYNYTLPGNQPSLNVDGYAWSKGVSPITPFAAWKISLPKTRINEDMIFEGPTVKIALTFKALVLMSDRISQPDLIKEMKSGSVMNDWDVVFNMRLDKINDALAKQYKKLVEDDKNYGGKIVVQNTHLEEKPWPYIERYSILGLNVSYGYPKMTFLKGNQDTVQLEMRLTSGVVKKGESYRGDKTDQVKKKLEQLAAMHDMPPSAVREVDGKYVFDRYFGEESAANKTLTAIVRLDILKGTTRGDNNIYSVVLDMNNSDIYALNVELSDDDQKLFNDAVKGYFRQHPTRYVINSLDLARYATIDDLKPGEFLFRLATPREDLVILQMFIQTGGRKLLPQPQINVLNPIPEQYECSLMVNNRILFSGIVPKSIPSWETAGESLGGHKVTKINKLPVSFSVDLSAMNYKVKYYKAGYRTIKHKPLGGNPVRLDIRGLYIKPASTGSHLCIDFDGSIPFSYEHGSYSGPDKTVTKDIPITIFAQLPLQVTGSGKDQSIRVNMESQSVQFNGQYPDPKCGQPTALQILYEVMQSQVAPQITDVLSKAQFAGLSVFALKNLLFPLDNYIELKEAHTPCDLLILGNFAN